MSKHQPALSTFIFACSILSFSAAAAVIPFSPCTEDSSRLCTDHPTVQNSMVCEGVLDFRTLVQILRCNRLRNLQEISLARSAFDHLPLVVLDFCGFRFLNLKDVTVSELVVDGDEMSEIQHLNMDNVTISGQRTWEPLALLRRLNRFSMQNMVLDVLDGRLTDHLSESLQGLVLGSTNTTALADYSLRRLVNLVHVSVQDNEIRELRRTMFPRPAKIKFFYFERNKISSLPEDLFLDMPDLQIISLQGNLIAEIHEHTFRHIWRSLSYVSVEGNPLKCSCKMLWLTKRFTPSIFRGQCFAPKSNYGTQLKQLQRTSFQCF